jgi:hypothetical protein
MIRPWDGSRMVGDICPAEAEANQYVTTTLSKKCRLKTQPPLNPGGSKWGHPVVTAPLTRSTVAPLI